MQHAIADPGCECLAGGQGTARLQGDRIDQFGFFSQLIIESQDNVRVSVIFVTPFDHTGTQHRQWDFFIDLAERPIFFVTSPEIVDYKEKDVVPVYGKFGAAGFQVG